MLLSPDQRAFLTHAAAKYQEQMVPEVRSYLASRGIGDDLVATHRLGYVAHPETGHEHLRGMVSIPYITRAGVVNLKTRCIRDHDCDSHARYGAPVGSDTYLYNVGDFLGGSDYIAVAEGEIDTLSLVSAGIPAVGVPGIEAWKTHKHWPYCFAGFRRVYIFADNDKKSSGRNPGMQLARRICDSVPSATVVSLPENEDVNACLLKYGPEFLRGKIK